MAPFGWGFTDKSVKLVQRIKNYPKSIVSQNPKKTKFFGKDSSSQPACNFILMMELRKKIITFRDIIDLPPCNNTISTNQLLVGTLKDLQKFYPGSLPRYQRSELKKLPLDKILIYFCKALHELGDNTSKMGNEWVEKYKNDIEVYENGKCKNVDKLVEIAMAELDELIKVARRQSAEHDDKENKGLDLKHKKLKDLKKTSSKSSSGCPSPTSVIPEATTDSPNSSSVTVSFRVQSEGKTSHKDVRRLKLQMFPSFGLRLPGRLSQKKVANDEEEQEKRDSDASSENKASIVDGNDPIARNKTQEEAVSSDDHKTADDECNTKLQSAEAEVSTPSSPSPVPSAEDPTARNKTLEEPVSNDYHKTADDECSAKLQSTEVEVSTPSSPSPVPPAEDPIARNVTPEEPDSCDDHKTADELHSIEAEVSMPSSPSPVPSAEDPIARNKTPEELVSSDDHKTADDECNTKFQSTEVEVSSPSSPSVVPSAEDTIARNKTPEEAVSNDDHKTADDECNTKLQLTEAEVSPPSSPSLVPSAEDTVARNKTPEEAVSSDDHKTADDECNTKLQLTEAEVSSASSPSLVPSAEDTIAINKTPEEEAVSSDDHKTADDECNTKLQLTEAEVSSPSSPSLVPSAEDTIAINKTPEEEAVSSDDHKTADDECNTKLQLTEAEISSPSSLSLVPSTEDPIARNKTPEEPVSSDDHKTADNEFNTKLQSTEAEVSATSSPSLAPSAEVLSTSPAPPPPDFLQPKVKEVSGGPPLPPPLPPKLKPHVVENEQEFPSTKTVIPPPPPPPPASLKSVVVANGTPPPPPPPPPAPLKSTVVAKGAQPPLPPPVPLQSEANASGILAPTPKLCRMLAKNYGALPPPPPSPMSTANGATPPPPPPPGGAGKSNRTRKTGSKLRRSSHMGNLYRNLKGKVEGSPVQGKSLGKKKGGVKSDTNGKQGMADALAEITRRSSYFQQIQEDVEKYAKPINEIKVAIGKFNTKDMPELLKFHKYVESILENLTDETQVLARYEDFPTKKLEALRTSSSLYSKLESMMKELESLKTEPPLSQLLDKVTRSFNKIKGEIDSLDRTKEAEAKTFKAYGIEFDFQIITRIKEATVDVSSNCMDLALKERREVKMAENEGFKTKDGAQNKAGIKLLWRVFQFAFQVYTFAGGHDDRAEKLTQELAHEIENDVEYQIEAPPAPRRRKHKPRRTGTPNKNSCPTCNPVPT